MKRFLFAAGLLLSALTASAANGYHITGTSEGVEQGDTVYLCEMQGFFSMVPIDTAYVENGKFEFSGDFDGAAYRYILPMRGGKPVAWGDFLLENADIDIQIFADANKRPIVKGGEANRMLAEYTKVIQQYDKEAEQPWKLCTDSTASKEAKAKAQAVVDSIQELKKSYSKTYLVANIPSALSDLLYAQYAEWFTEPEKAVVEQKMDAGHHYHYYKTTLAEKAADAATAVGQHYTDLAMPDTKGKMRKISEFLGNNRYMLIDFWASWCGPCRAEMPNVVKAYNAYHKKGFEVVGVSFDNNKEAWVKAVKQLKMPWPHISDLKGWGCAASAAYNIKGIPANVLVDGNGIIVAKNLRGDDLTNKLAELMK